jgi:hypothetical protein
VLWLCPQAATAQASLQWFAPQDCRTGLQVGHNVARLIGHGSDTRRGFPRCRAERSAGVGCRFPETSSLAMRDRQQRLEEPGDSDSPGDLGHFWPQ